MLLRPSSRSLRACSSSLLGRLRYATETATAASTQPGTTADAAPSEAAAQQQQQQPPPAGQDTADRGAEAQPLDHNHYQQRSPTVEYNTKTFGTVQVPAGVPLPCFLAVERAAKRAPVQLADALQEVKAGARAKFDETVELALRLGVDPRRGDHAVRGTATLPHGTGKNVRVAAFASGGDADAARQAGADIVGDEDLIEKIRSDGSGAIDFDKCVATPDMMPKLSKIARILGPRGLMPNPKLGTVAANVADAVRTMKAGRVEFRVDKGGVLHAGVGKVSFERGPLEANTGALVQAVLAHRPKGLKGGSGSSGYLLSATMSSTMGKGVPVAVPSLVAAAQVSKAVRA